MTFWYMLYSKFVQLNFQIEIKRKRFAIHLLERIWKIEIIKIGISMHIAQVENLIYITNI